MQQHPNSITLQQSTTWLPASTGPQPQGAPTWIVWVGGMYGSKFTATSGPEPVKILEVKQGGPTGTLVRSMSLGSFFSDNPHEIQHSSVKHAGYKDR